MERESKRVQAGRVSGTEPPHHSLSLPPHYVDFSYKKITCKTDMSGLKARISPWWRPARCTYDRNHQGRRSWYAFWEFHVCKGGKREWQVGIPNWAIGLGASWWGSRARSYILGNIAPTPRSQSYSYQFLHFQCNHLHVKRSCQVATKIIDTFSCYMLYLMRTILVIFQYQTII